MRYVMHYNIVAAAKIEIQSHHTHVKVSVLDRRALVIDHPWACPVRTANGAPTLTAMQTQ
jgi:hypothetical protein